MGSAMRILIADDDRISRQFLLGWLQPYGECDVATNGSEAFDAFKMAFHGGQPYDLVCLDYMMPDRSGLDALADIREFEETHAVSEADHAKIDIITCLEEPYHSRKAFYRRCDAYLFKPLDKRKLFQELGKLGLSMRETTATN